tara:strand:- start:40 stop:357 length:318 start_codon:yes stop_codon:yes gene_type:complete
MARVHSEYFGIFDNSDAGGNKPTNSGKLIVDADLLQAIIDVAHKQTEKGSAVQVELGLGFWEKTGQNSQKDYLWGRASVLVKDDSYQDLKQQKNFSATKSSDIPF